MQRPHAQEELDELAERQRQRPLRVRFSESVSPLYSSTTRA
jgi:hypothetical protein